MHEVQQRRLGGNCVVHEGRFQGVILVIANHTGGQGVVADQVCDDPPCIPAQPCEASGEESHTANRLYTEPNFVPDFSCEFGPWLSFQAKLGRHHREEASWRAKQVKCMCF